MDLTIDRKENCDVIRVTGRIDASSCENYKHALLKVLKEKRKYVLDLEGVDFIDSSGLGVLVTMLQKSLEMKGDVVVTNLNYKTRLVFEITRANNLFSIYNTLDKALESVA